MKKIILNLQADELEASVHGSHLTEEIYCTDCHQNRNQYRYPHQPNSAQNLQEFAADIAPACQTLSRLFANAQPRAFVLK